MAQLNGTWASIIPLNYLNHFEYSIMVVDTNWPDLVTLLAAPIVFMQSYQRKWIQSPAPGHPLPSLLGSAQPIPTSPVDWILNNPLTIELRSLFDRPDLAQFIYSILGDSEAYDLPDDSLTAQAQWRTSLIGTTTQEGLWQSSMANGIFIAEFAAQTALLQISYLPPFKVAPPPQGENFLRYSKNLTPATIGFLESTFSGYSAIVHQDLIA